MLPAEKAGSPPDWTGAEIFDPIYHNAATCKGEIFGTCETFGMHPARRLRLTRVCCKNNWQPVRFPLQGHFP